MHAPCPRSRQRLPCAERLHVLLATGTTAWRQPRDSTPSMVESSTLPFPMRRSPPAAISCPFTPLTNVRTRCTLRMRGSDDRRTQPETAAARRRMKEMGRRLSGLRIFCAPLTARRPANRRALPSGGVPWHHRSTRTPANAFEHTSKRRRGFPSETRVKRGDRVVHGDKDLTEKLGRDDPCPCGSGRRFQAVLLADGTL
jgi:hypothetical protein